MRPPGQKGPPSPLGLAVSLGPPGPLDSLGSPGSQAHQRCWAHWDHQSLPRSLISLGSPGLTAKATGFISHQNPGATRVIRASWLTRIMRATRATGLTGLIEAPGTPAPHAQHGTAVSLWPPAPPKGHQVPGLTRTTRATKGHQVPGSLCSVWPPWALPVGDPGGGHVPARAGATHLRRAWRRRRRRSAAGTPCPPPSAPARGAGSAPRRGHRLRGGGTASQRVTRGVPPSPLSPGTHCLAQGPAAAR